MVEELSGEQKNDVERIRTEVRPFAKTIVNKISLYANNKYVDGARMTAAIACAVMERVIVTVASRLYKDDRPAGERLIENVFEASKKNALAQWRDM